MSTDLIRGRYDYLASGYRDQHVSYPGRARLTVETKRLAQALGECRQRALAVGGTERIAGPHVRRGIRKRFDEVCARLSLLETGLLAAHAHVFAAGRARQGQARRDGGVPRGIPETAEREDAWRS